MLIHWEMYINLDLSNSGVSFKNVLRTVSSLGYVHILDLTNSNVIYIHDLGTINTLYLCGTEVTDISALGNVVKLIM